MRLARSTTSPPPRYWDEIAQQTSTLTAPPLWRVLADRTNQDLLARWLPGGHLGRILKTDLFDELITVGLAPTLAAHTDCLVGIDVSPAVGRIAHARTAEALVATADVRALPFRAGAFDAVVSHSTLDHFASRRDIGTALGELRRVLRPGGLLVITLDNLLNPLVAARNALAPWWQRLGVVPYAVGASYGPRGLSRALARGGFEVIELTAVHHLPRLALVAVERMSRNGGQAREGSRTVRLGVAAEALGRWPTRYLTGQYVAALARAGGLPGTDWVDARGVVPAHGPATPARGSNGRDP